MSFFAAIPLSIALAKAFLGLAAVLGVVMGIFWMIDPKPPRNL